MNMKLTLNKFVKDYYPFILFFVLMFVLHLIMGLNGDDVKYIKVLSNQNLFDFLQHRYEFWSSRLVIESIMVVLVRQNMILWKVFDSVLYTIGVYYLIKLINHKNSKHIALLGVLLFLMYPFHEMATAGWIATTLNYLWCFSFAMISTIPLINNLYGKKTSVLVYVISILSLLYAINQEQCCFIIFALHFAFLANSLIKKEKIDKYNLFVVLLSFAGLVYIFTCPGNFARFEIEAGYWYPDFIHYGIMEKLYLCVIPTVSLFLEQKIIFPLFYLILTVATLTKVKNKYLKYFLYLNIAFILFLTVFQTCLDISTLGSTINSATLSKLTAPFGAIVNLLPPLKHALVVLKYETISEINLLTMGLSFYLLAASSLMLVKVFDGFKGLILFAVGFLSKAMTAFSPTVFVSCPRTLMFYYFILIGLILMMLVKLFDEDKINAKWDNLMTKSFIVLAGVNYLLVFAIVFVKYGLFS